MSAPTIERAAGTLPMYTVLTPTGAILCRSRALDVALPYLTPDAVLLVNGEPFSPDAEVSR